MGKTFGSKLTTPTLIIVICLGLLFITPVFATIDDWLNSGDWDSSFFVESNGTKRLLGRLLLFDSKGKCQEYSELKIASIISEEKYAFNTFENSNTLNFAMTRGKSITFECKKNR